MIENLFHKFGIRISLINYNDLTKEKFRRNQRRYDRILKGIHRVPYEGGLSDYRPIRDRSIELSIPPNFNDYDRKTNG